MTNLASIPLLHAAGLHKAYSTPVLTDFSFELLRGEVHALVGSNGAGKSTFARILCGLTPADAGEVRLEGRVHGPLSRPEAEQAGVIIVMQELNVIGTLTVAENLFLSRLPNRAGFVKFSRLNDQAREALARVGLSNLDPRTPASDLGVGHQQLVEIAGALNLNCRVLILDEPTAALTDPEIDRLFANIRNLQAQGVGILYISHRMDEIRRIADRVTVLRDGRRVSTRPAAGASTEELVRDMVGHDLPARKNSSAAAAGPLALSVRELSAGDRVCQVSFEAHKGEILGIAGLIGSGRTELLRAVFGADRKTGGQIFAGNDPRPVRIQSPADAIRAGIGMVPEDRKHDGLLLSEGVRVNTTLATLPQHTRIGGWMRLRAERETTEQLSNRLSVRCASAEQPVKELSGGNQQKVVVARWLARDCRILLFDEPTRGIDVAAKDTMYQLLRELAVGGKAVVVVSSELQELLAICDRILVMSAGRLVAEFLPDNWSQEKITAAAFSGYLDREKSGAEAR